MVKKVDGKSPRVSTKNIQGTKAVNETKVGNVSNVGKSAKSRGSKKAEQTGLAINEANRDKLIQMIEEEAEKMFGSGKMSEQKKEAIKGAVKMAIDGAMISEKD